MEKFGIFELLDTLSALILTDDPAPAEPPEAAPKKDDAAFAPSPYTSAETPTPRTSSAAALSSFLKKHEQTVKKLDDGK